MSAVSTREAIVRQNEQVFRELGEHVARRKRLAIVKAPRFGKDLPAPADGGRRVPRRCARRDRRTDQRAGGRHLQETGAGPSAIPSPLRGRLDSGERSGQKRKLDLGNRRSSASAGASWRPRRVGHDQPRQPFDFLFVDEAWQMGWADFMLCGQVAARFVLIGDPGQIRPSCRFRSALGDSPQRRINPRPKSSWDPGISRLRLELPACRRLPPTRST
jgi:hypothetical protein